MAASLRDSTLIRMMNTGQYSDFTFSCSGEIFKVHKAVVVGQSDVIRAAVDGEFEVKYLQVISWLRSRVCVCVSNFSTRRPRLATFP
jgi:hypothetical protein